MESPSKLVNSSRQKDARTYNDAVTNSTSLNAVVDLFFVAGATRIIAEGDIHRMLARSYGDDPLLTLRVIFWAGNIRGGAGERRFFRIALAWLNQNHYEDLQVNVDKVPHFNRWDSLFHLDFELVAPIIYKGLKAENGLCAKWMPRKNQYYNFAGKFRSKYGLAPKEYRKWIVELSKTVEQQMCAKEWEAINYSHVPSVAMNKYRTAFFRNDLTRFNEFIGDVKSGKKEIKAGVIFPYQLYQAVQRGDDKDAVEAQWYAMPDYMVDNKERILPICDVSGSMTCHNGLPMAISVSLGLYLSERNKGIFKDAFVTFSGHPKMEYLTGSVAQRIQQLEQAHWDMNTNLNAVFSLLLKRAIAEQVASDEMPTVLLIISDMEFDNCASLTNYEAIIEKYRESGYVAPKIVFWNVNGRAGNVPVSAKQKNVALISGATPAVIKGVLSGKTFTPVDIMMETLNHPDYKEIRLG